MFNKFVNKLFKQLKGVCGTIAHCISKYTLRIPTACTSAKLCENKNAQKQPAESKTKKLNKLCARSINNKFIWFKQQFVVAYK